MKIIATFLIVLAILSCNQTNVDKKAEGEKVMQLSKEWSQTIATKDVVSILADQASAAYSAGPGTVGRLFGCEIGLAEFTCWRLNRWRLRGVSHSPEFLCEVVGTSRISARGKSGPNPPVDHPPSSKRRTWPRNLLSRRRPSP